MDKMDTISVGKTASGLLVVYQEKIENNTAKESNVKSDILDPQTFIGKNEQDVVAAIKDRCVFRVAARNGNGYELTASHLPFRWNLYIDNGVVTNIRMF